MEIVDQFSLLHTESSTANSGEVFRIENPAELLKTAHHSQEEWGKHRDYILNTYVIPQLETLPDDQAEQCIIEHLGEDLQWDWTNKALHTFRNPSYDWFLLKSDNQTQGLLTAYHPESSDLESGNVYYIDFLATAPWNRPTPSTSPRYKGVGTSLIIAVSNYYIEQQGYKPGFLLHSLPKAESYYSKLGMTDLGIDLNKENLKKFEMVTDRCLQMIDSRCAS